MADLDTASKRSSGVNTFVLCVPLAPVIPDATLDRGDRQHMAWIYSGIDTTPAGGFQSAWALGSNIVLQPGVTG